VGTLRFAHPTVLRRFTVAQPKSAFRTNPQFFLCGNKLWKSAPALLPSAVALFIVAPMRYLAIDSRGHRPGPMRYSVTLAKRRFAACGECHQ
jgi:hypothetical protein